MQAALNPFSPGSGLRPPALVGRESELQSLDVLVERSRRGLSSRGIVLSGLRGVGKTVLLNEMRNQAEARGWFVVSLEARPDAAGASSIRKVLGRAVATQARTLVRGKSVAATITEALATITAFNLSLGASGVALGVERAHGRADSGDLEIDLPELVQDLCAALADRDSVFGLFIDEFQDLDAELMRALLVTQHQAGQRGWPFYIVAAGLPNLPRVLTDARSYAERLFDYRTVARLPEDKARAALTEPAGPLGLAFEDRALALLLEASGGYPYFLQEYGRAVWDASPGPRATAEDARIAIETGLGRLDDGFFRSRWDRATRSERRFMVAMAEDGDGPSAVGDIARRLGMKPTSLGPYRAGLISKGLVYPPEHGMIAYTVPGMDGFVDRHREDL